MANRIQRCQGCSYNSTKKSGGFGRICNGLTMDRHGRCPEWRISEIIKASDQAYDRNKDYHEVV